MSDESAIAAKVGEKKKREIRIAAAKRDMSMSEFIRTAVDDALAELDEGNPNQRQTAIVSS